MDEPRRRFQVLAPAHHGSDFAFHRVLGEKPPRRVWLWHGRRCLPKMVERIEGQMGGLEQSRRQHHGGSRGRELGGPDRIDLFGIGTDGGLFHNYWDVNLNNQKWGGWEPLGGKFKHGTVAVVSQAPGKLDIVGIGMDDAMYHLAWNNGWSEWKPLGGKFVHLPAMATQGDGILNVFCVGADKQLYQKSFFNNKWQDRWEPLGGQCENRPSPWLGALHGAGAWHGRRSVREPLEPFSEEIRWVQTLGRGLRAFAVCRWRGGEHPCADAGAQRRNAAHRLA